MGKNKVITLLDINNIKHSIISYWINTPIRGEDL